MRGSCAFAALVVFLCAVAPRGGSAEDAPRIPAVTTTFAGRELRVSALLVPGLPAQVERRLGSGLPTTTVWAVRLCVSRLFGLDGRKDERLYEVTATYRTGSGDYSVERRLDGRLLETRAVLSRTEVTAALSLLPSLPSFTMGDHLIGKRLYVKVRCTYANGVALGLVPTSFETPWTRSRVFRWGGSGPE